MALAIVVLENSLNSMRADVAESDKRSRDDLTQVAKFMRELSSRVDSTERVLAQTGSAGKSIAEGVAALAKFTAQKAVNTMAAGDTTYLMNGFVETRGGTSDGSVTK